MLIRHGTKTHFLTSCPVVLSRPSLLSCLALLSCPLLMSSLPSRMTMLTSRPSAGISKKASLLFLTSCPLLLGCPLLLSCLLLFSCPLRMSFLPWRISMLPSRPSAGISKKHHCFFWWAVLCYWAALYCWATFHCSAVLSFWAFSRNKGSFSSKMKKKVSLIKETNKLLFSCLLYTSPSPRD